MKRKTPQLSKEEWPELRRIKAANKTGWSYFGSLVRTLHRELGEEKTRRILSIFMAENSRKSVKAGMKGFGITGKDPWSLASYFKLATGDIIGYSAELIEESPKKVAYRLHPPFASGSRIWIFQPLFAGPWALLRRKRQKSLIPGSRPISPGS